MCERQIGQCSIFIAHLEHAIACVQGKNTMFISASIQILHSRISSLCLEMPEENIGSLTRVVVVFLSFSRDDGSVVFHFSSAVFVSSSASFSNSFSVDAAVVADEVFCNSCLVSIPRTASTH